MNYEDAITCIKHEFLRTVNRADLTGKAMGEALDMAIEALEKQIPKPVRQTTSTKRCSRCNRQLSWSMNTQISKRYCPRCGQAIDWEA